MVEVTQVFLQCADSSALCLQVIDIEMCKQGYKMLHTYTKLASFLCRVVEFNEASTEYAPGVG